jgi:hypothetical protein
MGRDERESTSCIAAIVIIKTRKVETQHVIAAVEIDGSEGADIGIYHGHNDITTILTPFGHQKPS